MSYDTAHERDGEDATDKLAHDRMVAGELAKHAPGGNISFALASMVAGTTPHNIASLVALKVVRGHRTRRTVVLSSLLVWMDTRKKVLRHPKQVRE